MTLDDGRWPTDAAQAPVAGESVFGGHRLLGGLLVGRVRLADAGEGPSLVPVGFDPERPLLVVAP